MRNQRSRSSKPRTARLIVVYGIALFAVGILGVVVKGMDARSGLIAGFVPFLILFALSRPVRTGAGIKPTLIFTAIFFAAVTFMSVKGWLKVADGVDEKQFAASLQTAMAVISLAFFFVIKTSAAKEKPIP